MNIQEFLSLKGKYVARAVGAELIVVPLTDRVAQMDTLYTLNETGKFLWNNMQADSTVESLTAEIMEEFEIDEATVRTDIENFLSNIEKHLA